MKKKLFSLALVGIALSLASCTNGAPNKDDGSIYVTSVNLSYESYNFDSLAESLQLEAEVKVKEGKEYTGGITWRSSEPSVATVDKDGFVNPVSGGTTYITAIAGYKVGKCEVTVRYQDEDPGEFRLQESSVTVKTGTSVQLHPYVSGSAAVQNVVYKSENESVATVDSLGLVTGVSNGTTKVTATYSGKTVSCDVTVSDDAPSVFDIILSQRTLDIVAGASSTLTATPTEPVTINWKSDDTSIATVTDGVVKGISEGTTKVWAFANGKEVDCTVNVRNPSGGDEDEDKNVEVNFYIDYNNISTPIKTFKWYHNMPLSTCPDVPANPSASDARDPAFTKFLGWSTHTIIDDTSDLWNMATDSVDSATFILNLYGIWVSAEE